MWAEGRGRVVVQGRRPPGVPPLLTRISEKGLHQDSDEKLEFCLYLTYIPVAVLHYNKIPRCCFFMNDLWISIQDYYRKLMIEKLIYVNT